MRIESSVAIITGGGAGIGRALVDAFASAGARVVVGDVDEAAAQGVAEQVRARGDSAVAMRADAAADNDIRALIDRGQNEFGPADIFVANAGIIGPPGLGGEEQWDRTLDVNLRAHIRAARLLLPGWLERGSGHFVTVASAAGLLLQIGAAAYTVTKHAAVGFADWLAITYGDAGIGVTCVCPMAVETPLLDSIRESSDTAVQLSADAILNAGPVIEPHRVAEMTVDAVSDGRFLVLPHPEVAEMARQKAADRERWGAGMRRYQRSLAADG